MSNESFAENVVPGKSVYGTFQNTAGKYVFSEKFCKDKKVLDIGCGYGIGTEYLSRNADFIVGIDVNKSALKYAKKIYKHAYFVRADATRLPFKDSVFDTSIAFEVVEHVKKPEKLLKESARTLKKSGILLCSTPNKLFSSPFSKKPRNPHHVQEFFLKDIKLMIKQYFKIDDIYFQENINIFKSFIINVIKLMPDFIYRGIRKAVKTNFCIVNYHTINKKNLDPVYEVKRSREFWRIPCYFVIIAEKSS